MKLYRIFIFRSFSVLLLLAVIFFLVITPSYFRDDYIEIYDLIILSISLINIFSIRKRLYVLSFINSIFSFLYCITSVTYNTEGDRVIGRFCACFHTNSCDLLLKNGLSEKFNLGFFLVSLFIGLIILVTLLVPYFRLKDIVSKS
jgi:hypothetical protein